MSISSEITRIQNKRDQSFTEVANKGVTVPAGSTIDDLPGLIALIEQGSGGGYRKTTGTFVLTTDYTYAKSLADGYSGSLIVATGLNHIVNVVLWTDAWANRTMANQIGVGFYIANSISVQTSEAASNPGYYYVSLGIIKNTATNYMFDECIGGIVLHEACPNDIPNGSFGFRCRSTPFPIRAGMTVKWEAYGS